MSKAYWVTSYRSIKDQTVLAAYSVLATKAIEASGGRFIIRGIAEEVREQGMKARTVVIEFPNFAQAVAAYEAAAYQKALAVLGNAVERDLRIVHAVE